MKLLETLSIRAEHLNRHGSMIQFQDFSLRFTKSSLDLSRRDLESSLSEKRDKKDGWIVDGFNLSIPRGETLALMGCSGSGKTLIGLAVLGLLRDIEFRGSIHWKGENLLGASLERYRQLRGREVAMVFQEPMMALNPVLTVGQQVEEALKGDQGLSKAEMREKSVALLNMVLLDNPVGLARRYPHELSGGERQRVLIAMALACRPQLLIADEPISAIDLGLREEILGLFEKVQAETGMTLMLITHDLALVKRFAKRVALLHGGNIVETGDAEAVLSKPSHPFTQRLIDSQPKPLVGRPGPRNILLDVRQLNCQYADKGGFFRTRFFTAVHRENFVISRGETLGVVGKTGSGKTSLAMSVLRLARAQIKGTVRLAGIEILGLARSQLRRERQRFQPVFQDPYGALSPRLTVQEILEEGLRLHHPLLNKSQRRDRCELILFDVGLSSEVLNRYPHEFSGGQRQRISIARAALLEPEFIVLDEPTSALDSIAQRQILDLLVKLQNTKGLTYLFISHDLRVIRSVAHRTIVMERGNIVEFGATEDVMTAPRHPCTQELLDSTFPTERQIIKTKQVQASPKAFLTNLSATR